MSNFLEKLKGDIFPIFAICGIVGIVIWMFFSKFPWGITLTVSCLGLLGFALPEIILKMTTKKTVSQQWWTWLLKTEKDDSAKYLFCPSCNSGFKFPNKANATSFCVIFIVTIVIIVVGHLLWK